METNLNGEQTKTNMWRGIMLIRSFVLKLINSEKKMNCVGYHTNVQRIKVVDSSELTGAKFLIYLFIGVHLLLYCRCMDLRKRILFKKIRNHSQPLKLQKNIKICLKLT